MNWFKDIGLNEKQASLYMHVLEHGAQSASEIAVALKEQRTNVYLIVAELEEKGLVKRDESQPIVRFVAASPMRVQQLLATEQKRLAHQAAQLRKAMPELLGLHNLTSPKSGIAYFEGLKGYTATLDDAIRTQKEVCVFGASDVSHARPDAWAVLQSRLKIRAAKKIPTRMIFEAGLRYTTDLNSRKKQCIQVKFWGNNPFPGEIAVYGETVILTTYDEKLISLVVKNPAITATFQNIFDEVWESVKS